MATNNKVGPVLRTGEIATAVIEAVRVDNPNKAITIKDYTAYVRIETEDECIVCRDTIERYLGRPFKMSEIETDLSSFAGQIEMKENSVRFYLEVKQ